MLRKFQLYWRWLRIKRARAGRSIQVELPRFSRVGEQAAGDNFPVLAGTLARSE